MSRSGSLSKSSSMSSSMSKLPDQLQRSLRSDDGILGRCEHNLGPQKDKHQLAITYKVTPQDHTSAISTLQVQCMQEFQQLTSVVNAAPKTEKNQSKTSD
nr:hypothetical protein Iba_chr06cCG4310 [Ipomoea batatas]